jgi:hypothetical protein
MATAQKGPNRRAPKSKTAAPKAKAKPAKTGAKKAAVAKPRAKRPKLSVRAVLALADDASQSDAAIAAALAAMPEKGKAEVAAKWTARVTSGDTALVTRLLAMFELTALSATDASALAPVIAPLRAVGGLPEVFSHLENAMSSERAVVREAVCELWLADAGAQTTFDASQIDKLVRCAIAIAEAGDGRPDTRAAITALSRISHPGGRRALIEAIRHARASRTPELVEGLYAGLAGTGARDVVPFLVERLYVERAAFGPLVAAVAATVDNAAHRQVLASLAARAQDPSAIRALTLYADAVVVRGRSGGRLVELARAVLAWSPTNNDDARRLRHVFELALDAAVALARDVDAGAFLARANQLPDSPYSDYHVLARNTRTPALFEAARIREYLASGIR